MVDKMISETVAENIIKIRRDYQTYKIDLKTAIELVTPYVTEVNIIRAKINIKCDKYSCPLKPEVFIK